MSDLEAPRIRCPSCGKPAPAMKYCIYCGAKLPQAAPPTARSPSPPLQQPLPPAAPPSVPPPTPPLSPPPARVTQQPFPAGVKDEISNFMDGITILCERKVALLDLFQSGQVSEVVFLKLFNEYSGRLKDFLNARAGRLEELRSKFDERNKRVGEVALRLEELDVRRKIGEVDANLYNQKAEELRREERDLVDSLKTLRINIDRLSKILAEKKPSETRDLEAKVRSYQGAFEKLLGEGKISKETFNAVRPDIEETLDFFGSLIKDRKEKEKSLREQLETLQTRYKLSELSVEEYEKKKRELQAEIEKIWA